MTPLVFGCILTSLTDCVAHSIAVSTRENLAAQRQSFNSMSSRLTSAVSRFPALNSIMQRIGVRKRRDSIVLALVAAACIILIFLYKFA